MANRAAKNSLVTKQLQCNGTNVTAVVDTGAFTSVIDAKLVRENGWTIEADSSQLVHAAGGDLRCLGKVNVDLKLAIGMRSATVSKYLLVIEQLCVD